MPTGAALGDEGRAVSPPLPVPAVVAVAWLRMVGDVATLVADEFEEAESRLVADWDDEEAPLVPLVVDGGSGRVGPEPSTVYPLEAARVLASMRWLGVSTDFLARMAQEMGPLADPLADPLAAVEEALGAPHAEGAAVGGGAAAPSSRTSRGRVAQ